MILRRQLLLGAYVAAFLAPLTFIVAGRNPADSGALVLTTVGIGAVAFSAIVLQFVLVSRWRVVARPFGADLLTRFHRAMGLGLAALASAHVVLVVVARRDRLHTLVEDVGTISGIAAIAGLLSLTLMSWPRTRPAHSYERWRLIHTVLGVSVLGLVFVHVLRSGHFATNDVIAWVVALSVFSALLALFWLRSMRPFLLARRPFELVRVVPERGDAVSLVLRPARGDVGSWYPGQFGWLKLADRPFSLEEHPFSMSSSACDRSTIAFTCRAVGGFTRDLQLLRPGARFLVDGPHGSHRTVVGAAPRMLVVAGSGIAPAMSILRTMADLGDRSDVLLVYGIRTLDEAMFLEELEALRGRLSLDLVLVASREAPAWRGRRGRIDAGLVASIAPTNIARRECFVCGPGEFAGHVVGCLAGLGVPRWLIHAERF